MNLTDRGKCGAQAAWSASLQPIPGDRPAVGSDLLGEVTERTDKRPKIAARDVTLGRRAVRPVGTTRAPG